MVCSHFLLFAANTDYYYCMSFCPDILHLQCIIYVYGITSIYDYLYRFAVKMINLHDSKAANE